MTAGRLNSQKFALVIVVLWFAVGGVGHFVTPAFFVKIIPPDLPWRMQAVYVSGFFELAGAIGMLFPRTREVAGAGLILLTLAVTPANIYMWRNPELFPAIPEVLLALRLPLQAVLLGVIWWASFSGPRAARKSP